MSSEWLLPIIRIFLRFRRSLVGAVAGAFTSGNSGSLGVDGSDDSLESDELDESEELIGVDIPGDDKSGVEDAEESQPIAPKSIRKDKVTANNFFNIKTSQYRIIVPIIKINIT